MSSHPIRLGLAANWQQFTLLMMVNAFVGAMLGLERTIVPLIAASEFHLTSISVTLSFIISFGIVKALANLFQGAMQIGMAVSGFWWSAGSLVYPFPCS